MHYKSYRKQLLRMMNMRISSKHTKKQQQNSYQLYKKLNVVPLETFADRKSV